MRTIECNFCGEPITGEDDGALVQRLLEHVGDAHPDAPFDEERARADVDREAYSASDN